MVTNRLAGGDNEKPNLKDNNHLLPCLLVGRKGPPAPTVNIISTYDVCTYLPVCYVVALVHSRCMYIVDTYTAPTSANRPVSTNYLLM